MTAEVTTDRPVNAYQLGLDCPDVGFRAIGPRPDGTTTIRSDDLDQAALERVVAAHDADPAIVPPSEPVADDLDPVRAKVVKITNAATRDALLALLDALG